MRIRPALSAVAATTAAALISGLLPAPAAADPSHGIVGGTPAADGAYPWVAHLSMLCGGSLASPARAPRSDESAILSCPRCRGPLIAELMSGALADCCDACGGVWLDHDVLERILAKERSHPTLDVALGRLQPAQLHLKGQLRRREPERVYLAVVYGHPNPPAGTWRDHLVWDDDAVIQKETHPRDPRGTEAISHYRVVESMRDTSLLEVRLHTGKRNQIRLQARLHGHTLVGERRYVYGPDSLRPIEFARQALHAFRLAFIHPRDGRTMRFEAPLPAAAAP